MHQQYLHGMAIAYNFKKINIFLTMTTNLNWPEIKQELLHAIEFQKWGLPHMHLWLFLKTRYKLISPDIVNCIISTQWPDPVTQPHLFEKVKEFLVSRMYNHDGYPHYNVLMMAAVMKLEALMCNLFWYNEVLE
jgi:hypothetical protein